MRDLFRDPRCQCPSVVDLFHAEVNGTDVEPCEFHFPEEVKARAAARERDEAQRRLARERVVFEEIRDRERRLAPDPNACRCPGVRELASLVLEGRGVDCPAHPVAAIAPGSTLALNDDDGLAAIIGMAFAPSDNRPPDAA